MANTEKNQGKESAQVLDAEVLEAEIVQESSSPGKGRGLSLFACLIALLACLAVAWLWWTGQQQQEQIGTELGAYSSSLQSSQQNLAGLQRSLTGMSNQLQRNQDGLDNRLAEFERSLRGQRSQIQDLSHTDRTDWQLAEVEYLLRLANQRLLMAAEPRGARALLQRADSLLVELDDMALHSARRAIADDLAALRAVDDVDIEGLYLRLGAAAKLAGELDYYKMPEVPTTEKIETSDPQLTEPAWWQTMLSVWNENLKKLKGFVVIQRRDELVQTLPSMQHQKLVREHLQLLLAQAQLALLRGQQAVFSDSLNAANELVQKYYVLENSNSQAVLEVISEATGVAISPDLPDISGSLNEIKNYISDRHRVPVVNASRSKPVLPDAQEEGQPQ
jgi:uroporphyrin-3 C-methyltransferase